ncbi:MAG: dihydropteridine reductase [Ruminococcaceae bacterium]|nr:dihydropteridine reductase [Oscillospiraceae bacterium]
MNRNDLEFTVQKIRTQYTEKEHTQLDMLLTLDKKVRRPALVFAWIFGVIGSLVLGTGMTLAMQVIEPGTYFGITIGENTMLSGILIGLVGILMVSVNYPLYRTILTHRKNKYSSQIVALSDEIVKG